MMQGCFVFLLQVLNQSLATTMKTMVKMALSGSFTSLVFTANGGMSTEIKQFYSWLSQLLCEKSDVSLIRVHVLNSKKVLVSFKHPLLM